MLEKIRDILLLHEGENNPISSSKIAKTIGIQEDDTHARTRALILECAKKYDLPVAANKKGYFLITSKQEYGKYMENLDLRSAGIEERKRIITERFKRWEK